MVITTGLKRESVLEQTSRCLSSLQVECVDLLYLHAPDHNTPVEETLGAIQELYKGACCYLMKIVFLFLHCSWEIQGVWTMQLFLMGGG